MTKEDPSVEPASKGVSAAEVWAWIFALLTVAGSFFAVYRAGFIISASDQWLVNWPVVVAALAASVYAILFACLFSAVKINSGKLDVLLQRR